MRWLHIALHLPMQGKIVVQRWRGYVKFPSRGETPEVVRVATDCGRWLADSRIPKLFINAEPGAVLTGRRREFCRTWRNQTEVTVEGIHFVQEDSPEQIGKALAAFVRSLRSL